MPIEIDEAGAFNDRFFRSRHFIAYPIGGGSYTIVRSGVVLLPNESVIDADNAGRQWVPNGFKGTGEADWRGDSLTLSLDLRQSINRLNPPPPNPGNLWVFRMDQWAPIASLNSIYNSEVSNYAGSSVNTFAVSQPTPSLSVNLEMDIAVRDTDGYLYRIGYYVTLVGGLVQQTPVG